MNDNQARCPNCHAPVSPDARFCGSCGKPIEVSQKAAAAPAVAERHPFALEVSLPEAMRVDCFSTLLVRFRANTDIYESVEFVLRNGQSELARTPCCQGRPGFASHEVLMNVKPRAAGRAMVELDAVCRIGASDPSEEVFTAVLDVEVDDSELSKTCPIIHVAPNISSDRAGDTNVGNININLGGQELSMKMSANQRYETRKGVFVPVRPRLVKSPQRLTLKGARGVIQLVSDNVVTFGRHRDNVIPLRVCGQDGRVDPAANGNNLSRFHFRIENTGRDCRIADGQDGKPSAYGTRVDGGSIGQGGSARLRPGASHAVAAGRGDVELMMDIGVYGDRYSRPSGFLMERRDGSSERVCAVWQEVPVDGCAVVWNGSCWSLKKSPSDASGSPLCAGTEILLGGAEYSVLPFHHINLD